VGTLHSLFVAQIYNLTVAQAKTQEEKAQVNQEFDDLREKRQAAYALELKNLEDVLTHTREMAT
jgi:hypothetical protein